MPRAPKKDDPPPRGYTDEIEVTDRDFVMARIGAARAAASDALSMLDEAMSLMVNPHDDEKGKKRKANVKDALEALGVATSSLELAEANIDEYDPTEEEPGDEDEDEDDEEDDDEEGDDDDGE